MTLLILIELIVFICCITLSALFSGSETSLFSISKIKLNTLKKESETGALINELLKNPQKLIITILLGNIAVNVFSTTISENLIREFLNRNGLRIFGQYLDYVKEYNELITITIMTFIILIFGEITPKTIALANSVKIALKAAPIINKLSQIIEPIYKILGKISNAIIEKITEIFPIKTSKLNEDELKLAIELGLTDGMLTGDEEDMLKSVFEFSKTRVREIMTPKPDIVFCSIDNDLSEVLNLFNKSGLSRLPVYEKCLNNICGFIYKKDLFLNYAQLKQNNWTKLIRPAYITPELKSAASLLKTFKTKKIQIALVVDEFGGLTGIITIKDLIDEIFGEILERNHQQQENKYIKKIGLSKYKISGRMNIEYFNELFQANISDDAITINGYIIKKTGKIPNIGEEIIVNNNLKLVVDEVSKNEIKSVRVEKI
ncbi:MAG TPA: hemolysin family protein [bacterium]|nr:hemolysin family protein [bacterium]